MLRSPLLALVGFSLLLSAALYRNPISNWDSIAYAAVVHSQSTSDSAEIHRQSYQDMREATDAPEFQRNTSGPRLRSEPFKDPVTFVRMIPLYSIRPLYTSLLRLGTNPIKTAHAVSAISFFAISLLSFLWLRPYISDAYAAAISLALMCSAPLIEVGRYGTPDALSAAILVAALWSLHRERITLSSVLLLASIFIRTDNSIIAVIAFLFIRRYEYAAFSVACVGLINHLSGNYGLAALLQHSTLDRFAFEPAAMSLVPLYKRALSLGIFGATTGGLAFFAFPAACASLMRNRIALIILIASILRFFLYPVFEQRHYVPLFVLGFLVFSETIAKRLLNHSDSTDAHDFRNVAIAHRVGH